MEKRVLVADDELEFLSVIKEFLTERGYTVFTAQDGQTALQLALEKKPHLILLDVMMPGMDGTDTAIALREEPKTRRIPVFFITGAVTSEEKNATKGNPNTIFAKPVNFEELLKTIQRMDIFKD